MFKKPMLAEHCKDMQAVKFPVLGTPKLDGIRCCIKDQKPISRTFKLLPNKHVQKTLSNGKYPDGLDGEVIIEGWQCREISGWCQRKDGEPLDFNYYVFDYVGDGISLFTPYDTRMKALEALKLPPNVKKLIPVLLKNHEELLAYEAQCVADGYEGVMIRSVDGPYKEGRSTVKEGWLLKVKRFEDSEAVVTGFYELQHNDNEAQKDNFGRTKRSSHKENKTPGNTLGGLYCEDVKSKMTFKCGSGFNAADRKEIWDNQKKYLGKTITYKYQPHGTHEAPRHPIFKMFRAAFDMDKT